MGADALFCAPLRFSTLRWRANPSRFSSRQPILPALIVIHAWGQAAKPVAHHHLATAKSLKHAALIFVGLTLISSGCSSLQSPAADRAAWLAQQEEEHPDYGRDIGWLGPVPLLMPTKNDLWFHGQ